MILGRVLGSQTEDNVRYRPCGIEWHPMFFLEPQISPALAVATAVLSH
jgi:hypothetical protein